MTLLDFATFDTFSTGITGAKQAQQGRWSFQGGSASGRGEVSTTRAKTGTKSIYNTAGALTWTTIDPTENKYIVGAHFNINASSGWRDLFIVMDRDTLYPIHIQYDSVSKNLRWARQGTVLDTSTETFEVNTWYHLEIKFEVANSTASGTNILKVDGAEIFNLAAASDTQHDSVSDIKCMLWGGIFGGCYWDNIYICDTNGSINNDFLGECIVETIRPNGNGNSSQFTGQDADSTNNYQNVDDTTVDTSETTYNGSSTTNHIDLYTFDDLSSGGTVKGVKVHTFAKKTDIGNRAITHKIRSGGTNYSMSEEHFLAEGLVDKSSLTETDPNTASAWTVSGVNSAEFGVEVTT